MSRFGTCTALLLFCSVSLAQGPAPEKGLLEKTQSFLDEVGKGMRNFGEKAEGIFGPGMGLDQEKPADFTKERDVSERKETGPAPLVSVSNEFGEIHIDTWDERVVRINAKVIAGAESASVAEELSRSIDVQITTGEDLVQVRPVLPDRHLDMGAVSMQANLYITAPRGANVVVDNAFGDTYVRGVGGFVALESQHGLVDLGDIGGAVKARVRGPFPLRAAGLKAGGQFQLHDSQAEFSEVTGGLQVNSFGGSVAVRGLQPEASFDMIGYSTAIHLLLPRDAKPDLTATALYGSIDSQLPVTRSEQGPRILARHGSPDAKQRIDISATIGEIRVEFEGSPSGVATGPQGDDKPYDEIVSENHTVTPYTRLQIEAVRGDIVLEASDDPGVNISATRIAWVPSPSKARAALDALPLKVQKDADRLTVRTLLTGDLTALECSDYRINLKIRYPRNLPIAVMAEDGHTRVSGSVGQATIEQTAGAVSAADCAGPLTLTNKNGGIRVSGAAGTVEASARYGDSFFERVTGTLTATCVKGGTVIDKPGGAVSVRNSLGNVRVLALDGMAGDMDIKVEDGDLSVVLGDKAYSELSVAVEQGTVDSAIPLEGSILGRNQAKYRGFPRQGQFKMELSAKNGDIVLD
ncbi:MAG: hypothetical protein JNK74_23430 [Candidatus Hydrogenedentes bacterium]|nr:hypothetical protein [Candidatus Hydrogenedentota bacterium]